MRDIPVRALFRSFGRRVSAALALAICSFSPFLFSGCGGNVANVQLMANPNRVPSTGTSTVLAILTAPSGGPPANGTAVAFTSKNTAAGDFPTNGGTVKTSGGDRVSNTFTAGTVTIDTVVTVKAKADGEEAETTITVLPPLASATAAATGPTGPRFQIDTSVTRGPGGLVYVYTLTALPPAAGGPAPTIDTVSLTFAQPMTVTAPGFTPASANGNRAWVLTIGTGVATATITARGDASPGGTTAFDVLDKTSGPAFVHYLATPTGPK